jgi:hypothetical protein
MGNQPAAFKGIKRLLTAAPEKADCLKETAPYFHHDNQLTDFLSY